MTKLEKALDEYYEKFDENYPLVITTMMSAEEIIEDVQAAIRNNKKKDPPEYEEGADY